MGTNKKLKKRKRVVEPEEEDTFAVEYILKARVTEDALEKAANEHWDYYVKWAGYDSDANTWEPAKNLAECQRLVASFWDAVGWDNDDYSEGTEVVASKKWIAAEKQRFWQNLTPEERENYSSKENERRAQASRTEQTRAFVVAGTIPDISSDELTPEPAKRLKSKKKKTKKSQDDDVPLKEKLKSKTIPAKRKKAQSSSVSSDEEPLNRRRQRLKKVPKRQTPAESSAGSSKPSPRLEIIELDLTPPNLKADKGKQKAIAETRSESPSSLFSVDMEEEVIVPPSHTKLGPPPAPERKSSTILLPSANKGNNAKANFTAPSRVPQAVTPNSYLQSPTLSAGPPRLTGISTKQRLSLGASIPVNPKEAKDRQLQQSKSNLTQLKFTKSKISSPTSTVFVPNELTVDSPATNPQELTLNALNAPTNKESPINMFTDSFQTESPLAMEPPQIQIPQPYNSLEADEFLSSMAGSLPGLTTPLETAPEPAFVLKPPPSLLSQRKTKTTNIPKIQKKWKWEGQLFILKTNDQEELVGSVVCTNATSPKPKGMRIPLTFDSMDRLNFISFHALSDVFIFLEACKTADQFATLSAQDGEGPSKFKIVADYLAKHQQVVLVPVWYEKNLVGHLLVFSVTCDDLIRRLEVPSELLAQAKDNLIVSLHGWNLKVADRQKESRLSSSDIVPASTSLAPCFEKGRTKDGNPGPSFNYLPSLRNNTVLHFAFRVLNFPPDLFEWLTTSHRIYAVYHEQERRDDKAVPIEFKMLKAIMTGCQAQEWKHNESKELKKEYRLRIVFVHVGSVSTFSRSPLTQKRNTLDIRFYSYGTDGNTPRSMWGVREIYPIGGVVTLYPSAFTEDYAGTMSLIKRIHEHPLWIVFISPVCLGYLAITACDGQDPLALYDSDGQNFIYSWLLRLIATGEIALITAPPESTTSTERMESWTRNYCRMIGPLDALSIGIAAFNSLCGNDTPADSISTVQKNVNSDIVAIQRHPAILYQYRRFVVVKGPTDQTPTPNYSVEPVTPRQFTFQDDYFKREM